MASVKWKCYVIHIFPICLNFLESFLFLLATFLLHATKRCNYIPWFSNKLGLFGSLETGCLFWSLQLWFRNKFWYSSCGTWWHTRMKPDFIFPRNGRVHLNRWVCQFSRLLAAEVCASAWVMLDIPRSKVAWEYWLLTPFASFPFTSPPVRHRVPPGSERAIKDGVQVIVQRFITNFLKNALASFLETFVVTQFHIPQDWVSINTTLRASKMAREKIW